MITTFGHPTPDKTGRSAPRSRSGLIGLMIIRDEEDMLAEALRNHARFCQTIFVLDGTTGDGQRTSQAICESVPQVLEYWQDHETGYTVPLRDGARQFLLDRARERFGCAWWYAILHGDEIWGEDPRPYLERGTFNHNAVMVDLYHFFPHTSDRHTWRYAQGDSIEDVCTWYMLPPIPENRLFWDSGAHAYEVGRHSLTIPVGLESSPSHLVVKQYNYRTPEQAHRRAVHRRRAMWQSNHYEHLLEGPAGFFVESLGEGGLKWGWSVPTGGGQPTNIVCNPLPTWR